MVTEMQRRYRSCMTKIPYTRDTAEMVRKSMPEADDLVSYYCQFCANWHIGHPMKRHVMQKVPRNNYIPTAPPYNQTFRQADS